MLLNTQYYWALLMPIPNTNTQCIAKHCIDFSTNMYSNYGLLNYSYYGY